VQLEDHHRRVYIPWTPGIKSSWSVSQVRSALRSLEDGDFSDAAQLVDAMGRDDRLTAVLQTRINALLRADFKLMPADVDSEDKAAEAAAMAESWWWRLVPEAQLAQLLRWWLMCGVAIGEIVWELTADEWRPCLKVWDMQWAWADREERCYYLTTREGQIKVPYGGGDGKWIVLGQGESPWMNGLARCLAIPWLVRQFAMRDWARYSERHGMPIVLADVPAVSDAEDKDAFQSDLAVLSTDTTIQLPTNVDEDGARFDLRLLEATDQNSDGFKDLIRHVDDCFAIALTGNNLTTQIDAGSLAAAQVGGEVKRERTLGDAQMLSTELHCQLLEFWAGYNLGDIDLAPWPHWDVAPPVDLKLEAETLVALGTAVASLSAVGLEVDDIERFGVHASDDIKPPQRTELADAQPATMADALAETFEGVLGLAPHVSLADVEGQDQIDELTEDSIERARGNVGLREVLAVVESSESFDEVRERLYTTYAEMDASKLNEITTQALVLGDLIGRWAVLDGLDDG
jgi:phage gp29-like protein